MTLSSMNFAGFRVRNTNSRTMVRFLQNRIVHHRKLAVGFANHHFVTACQTLDCSSLGPEQLLLLNDGVGMQLAAMLRFGQAFAENMNGTDFVPLLLHGSSQRQVTVYLVGSTPDVVRRTASMIADISQCQVVGFCDGFSLWRHETAVIEDIATVMPDILLVGLGNPLQERWILTHWPLLHATIIIGVGALFEWMTGTRRRAPAAIRRVRMEWAYRLAIDPRRLLRRYTVDGVRFFTLLLADAASDRLGRRVHRRNPDVRDPP